MLKLEARPQPSPLWSYASPILALVITVLIGVALFVALVVVTPAMLLQGLVAGVIGPGRQLDLIGFDVILGPPEPDLH